MRTDKLKTESTVMVCECHQMVGRDLTSISHPAAGFHQCSSVAIRKSGHPETGSVAHIPKPLDRDMPLCATDLIPGLTFANRFCVTPTPGSCTKSAQASQ